jgi:hypothetical protein
MAQLKQVCTVANGGQTVSVIGVNVAYRIRRNNIFMVASELVPYTVAADATFDGANTIVKLTGAYQGVSNPMAPSAFVTDFTAPDSIPLISQGDVGTAAIWTAAMYQLQAMIGSVTTAGLNAFIAQINATQAAAAASEVASKTSETNSKTSETNAGASKAAAAVSAAAALVSQNAAKISETNSKTSETNSSASAGDARTSNTQSGASAAASEVSRQASVVSAAASAASAAAALISKTNAGTSETNAAASAAAALVSKNNAGTSETNAGTSKAAAAASAAAALASQNAAKTSETNSKTSETNTATNTGIVNAALATVQGIVTTMNALYLGKLAADPVKDNNGAALQVGAEYFNTTKQMMRVYTSTGWQDVDQTSETMAANATASAAAAAGSAAGAASSLTSAQASQAAALASQNAVKTSETNSKTSESNSASSAAASLASQNASKTSENNSKTSETNAAASAAHADAVSSSIGNPISKNGDEMIGQLRLAEGTVLAPSLSFANDGKPDTGLFHISDGAFGVSNDGVETARFTTAGAIYSKDLLTDNAKFQSTRYGNFGSLVMARAEGSSAAPTAVVSSNIIASMIARAYDGAAYRDVASISATSDGAVSANASSGYLTFNTTAAGTVDTVERMRVTASGRVLIGTGTDDGGNMLQVNGTIKGVGSVAALRASSGLGNTQSSIMITRDAAAVDEKSWEMLHGSTGSFTLRAINDAYSVSTNAIVVNRPAGGGVNLTTMNLMSGGGRVLVGSFTDDGASALQVGGTFTAMSNVNGTVGNFSPFSYGGGVAIEAYNLGNSTKKNVALSPWGGRVLVGTTTDDGTNLLQVNGSGSFVGGLQTTGAITVNSAGEGNIKVGQNDGYFYGNSTGAGWYSPTKGSFGFNLSDGKLNVQNSPVWTAATFDPSTRVLKSGDTMTGALTVGGQISTTAGSLSISGWTNNTKAGVLYFGPNANNKYLYYDGTNFQFSGGSLNVNGYAVWNTQNLASPFQTTGGTITGQTDVTSAHLRMLNGSLIDFFSAGNSYSASMRADPSGMVGFLNGANSAWNLQINEGGVVNFPRARPTWAGLTPWDNGNFNPNSYQVAGSYIRQFAYNAGDSFGLTSGSPPSIASITTQSCALVLQNQGNNAASCVINFRREGAFAAYFGLDTDNQWAVGGGSHGAVRYRLWHEGNFNPGAYQAAGSYASLSAQVQWGSGISEVAGVVTGADLTVDAGGPWVMEGLRTVGGSSRIYMRLVWLRNQ